MFKKLIAICGAVFMAHASPIAAAEFVENTSAPFGTFNGVDYVIHTGRFVGETSRGAFRMPYEIVAPADPWQGTRTVLVEPPHFALGLVGRDGALGRNFLFDQGIRYAAVGFGTNGFNSLEPFAADLVIAGTPLIPPVTIDLAGIVDEEIIVQFTNALQFDPFGVSALGTIDRRYAYGLSQTSAVMLETLLGPSGLGLFDLTFLHIALWRPPFAPQGVFDFVPEGSPTPVPFIPASGVGRVMFVESEGDQVVSDAEFFRAAVGHPDYRLYEVAGAAHDPTGPNFLNHLMVMRAIYTRGDEWVREGVEPPPNTLIAEDTSGGVDSVYGFPTGIARDADLNALGGVRLPDLEVGRAQFIASDFSAPGLPGLVGAIVDLACALDPEGSLRFENHGEYVSGFVAQANTLRDAGFLLAEDAEALKEQAAGSTVGKPDNCAP